MQNSLQNIILKAIRYLIISIDHKLFNQSPVIGHLGYIQFSPLKVIPQLNILDENLSPYLSFFHIQYS